MKIEIKIKIRLKKTSFFFEKKLLFRKNLTKKLFCKRILFFFGKSILKNYSKKNLRNKNIFFGKHSLR